MQIALNNVEVSSEHILRLKKDAEQENDRVFTGEEHNKVVTCAEDLLDTCKDFKTLLQVPTYTYTHAHIVPIMSIFLTRRTNSHWYSDTSSNSAPPSTIESDHCSTSVSE